MFENAELISFAEKVLGVEFKNVNIIDNTNVLVRKNKNSLTVGGGTVPQKLRALTLAYINRDKESFEISQTPVFSKLGVMADASRGAVMRAEKVKEFMLKLAMMGSNQFMLYTEDTYTLEEYPHFGYARGGYTDSELKEIADFADGLQMEIIPCIQTLGHMSQYLSWKGEAKDIKDTDAVLLCDSDATYRFIEAEIAKMKSIFKTDRIHIGMDEAWDMGLGEYINKFGYGDRYTILKRHLKKVVDICKTYGLKPIMWSDMFFRLGSDNSDYYNTEIVFPEDIINDMPDVELVYWDYYHSEKEIYDKMIARHKELGKPVSFAGVSYSYKGFLVDCELSFKNTEPALLSCMQNGVDDIWATMWGDDGHEIDLFDALYPYAMFTEMCYNPDYTMDDIRKMGMTVSKITPEIEKASESYFTYSHPKTVIWGDVFYNLLGIDFSVDDSYKKAKKAYELCSDEYTSLVLKIFYTKADIYANMHADYIAGKDMSVYADEILPTLLDDFKKLYRLFSDKWLASYKVFGYEVIQLRFNTTIGRLEYAVDVVSKYSKGLSDRIEELELTPQYGAQRSPWFNFVACGRAINYF